jgi:tetracycline repressor-like protein
VEERHGLGLIRLALQNLVDEGAIPGQPVEPLAHAILGTLIEAGLYVARADQVDVARAEMDTVLRRMLEGLRSPG